MSAQALDSFYVDLFFNGDTKGADEFTKKLMDVKSTAMGIAGVAIAAAAAVTAFVGGIASNMADLNDFAETNDISASKLDALGKVAKAADVNMDQLKSSVQGLNTMIGEASKGLPKAVKMFEIFGISAKDASGNVRSVDEMLEVVADKIKAMPNRSEQLAMLQKLRIDPSMVKLLKDGGQALREMREEAEGKGFLSDDDYAKADHIDKLFMRAGNTAGVLSKMLAVKLFPAVEKIIGGYLDWFTAQRKATSSSFMTAFKMLGAALETAWEWVVRLKDGIMFAVNWLQKFNILTWAAGIALAVYAGVGMSKAITATYELIAGLAKQAIGIATNITLMGALTAAAKLLKVAINGLLTGALFLIINDLVNWYEDNDSLIGQLYNQYPQALAILGVAIAGLTLLMNTFGIASALAWLGFTGPVIIGIGLALMAFAAIGTAAWYFWDEIKSVGEKIRAMWNEYILAPIQKAIDLFNKFKSFVGGALESQVNVSQNASPQLSGATAQGGVLGRAEGSSNSSTSNRNINIAAPNITVNSNNPKEVAEGMDKALGDAMRNGQVSYF